MSLLVHQRLDMLNNTFISPCQLRDNLMFLRLQI